LRECLARFRHKQTTNDSFEIEGIDPTIEAMTWAVLIGMIVQAAQNFQFSAEST
jgi:hypothetical protein